jgi:uncharacterized protein
VFDDSGWEAEQQAYQASRLAQRALDESTVEAVRLGIMLVEQEHHFESDASTAGVAFGKKFRETGPKGWFEFDIAVDPTASNELMCTFWSGDSANIPFDISVSGTIVASPKLEKSLPAQFYTGKFALPPGLTRGATNVRLRFSSRDRGRVGRVFECRSLKIGL